jgi:hypothetical protein
MGGKMTTTLEIKAFTYDELSQDAQKKVYEDWRNAELECGIWFNMDDTLRNFKKFIEVYDCKIRDYSLSYDNSHRDYIKFSGDLTMQGQDLIDHLESCTKKVPLSDYPSETLVDFVKDYIENSLLKDEDLSDVLQEIAQEFIRLWHDEVEYHLSEEAFNDLYLYQDDLYFDAKGNQITDYDNVKEVIK